MTEVDPTWAERIVAEFGDGFPVDGIAARYGLTVEQVYAVVEREVGPAGNDPAQGSYGAPPGYGPPSYGPPGYGPPGYGPPGYGPPGYGPPGYYAPPPGQGQQVPPPQPAWPAPDARPPAYAPPSHQPAQPFPGYQPQQPFPGHQPQRPFPDEDAIVAEYADGHPVDGIALRHGLTVDQIYALVRRALRDEPPPATPG